MAVDSRRFFRRYYEKRKNVFVDHCYGSDDMSVAITTCGGKCDAY